MFQRLCSATSSMVSTQTFCRSTIRMSQQTSRFLLSTTQVIGDRECENENEGQAEIESEISTYYDHQITVMHITIVGVNQTYILVISLI